MNIIFRTHANEAGIYKITNAKNGRVYIGSTSRFKQRAQDHNNTLKAKTHTNTFMQNDYNLCGGEHFLFEVLEVVDGDQQARLAREQFYLDEFYDNQKSCYNLSKNAFDNRSGSKNKNPANRETDKRCQSPSAEVVEKRVEAVKAAYVNNPELKEVSRQNANKRWDAAVYPEYHLKHVATGEEVVVNTSLRAWCTERGLYYKAFHLLVKGKTKTSGGWSVVNG